MGRSRAVLCGYYGQGNGGDEALLASLLQMLPDSITPVVLSGNPVQTWELYGVEACDRKSFFAVLQALRQADAFIWGGGSLMQDATSLFSPIYYGGLMALAQRMELTTIAWGQGIGPLNRSFTRWIARETFAACKAVSVRDRGSAALLNQWNISCTLAPDPVWALEASNVSEIWELPAPRVAVVLRTHSQLTRSRLEMLTQALADFQTATNTCILLIPFQPAQDLALAKTVSHQLRGPNEILCFETPQELKGVFRSVEMTIGMRLHSLIMAAAEGCRCFALSYDPKIDQLMDELHMPGWSLTDSSHHPPLPETANEISMAWLEHYANGDPLSKVQIQALVDRALIHQEILQVALRSLA